MLSNPEVFPQLLQMPFGSAEHWRVRLAGNAVPGKPDLLLVAVTDGGEVDTDNHKAQALYKRFGFVEEGVHRCHALRDGVYVDSLSMARLNPAPLRGFPRD
jgi:hypothetical protein